jgi:hypothetical protein
MRVSGLLYPPPNWRNQPVVLYHGTTVGAAEAILADGVTIEGRRSDRDFGAGFYTTTLQRQARHWAWRRVEQEAGTEPAVVRFEVDRDELARLESLAFVRGDYEAEDFWSFVVHCRTQRTRHARLSGVPYDVVSGPVTAFWDQRATMPDSDQVSFHTAEAVRVLNTSGRAVLPWRY